MHNECFTTEDEMQRIIFTRSGKIVTPKKFSVLHTAQHTMRFAEDYFNFLSCFLFC